MIPVQDHHHLELVRAKGVLMFLMKAFVNMHRLVKNFRLHFDRNGLVLFDNAVESRPVLLSVTASRFFLPGEQET
jgi:hypothetical protein